MWFAGRWWSRPVVGLAALVTVASAIVIAWWVDDLVHQDEAVRNTELSGRLIGGLGMADLNAYLDQLDQQATSGIVEIDLGDEAMLIPGADLGISVDREQTLADTLAVGRSGPVLDRIRDWAVTLDERRSVAVTYAIDPAVARATLDASPLTVDRTPVHPSATFDGEVLVAVDGAPGRGIDVEAITTEVVAAVAAGDFDEVDGSWEEIPSPLAFGTVESTVAGIHDRVGSGIVVTLNGTTRWIPPKPLYSWISSSTTGGELQLHVDTGAALAFTQDLFADASVGTITPVFEVGEDGAVALQTVGDERRVCCSAELGRLVEDVILGERLQPLEVPLRDPTDDESLLVAGQFGVEEIVGEFTTNHACCQGRVSNIHRIADIVRGYVIPPGEYLSINEYVGRRTREGGFVGAGTIQSGRFIDGVGGGISQFATTLFNAAFFAGLDIPTYQSHSIYISRYPYGREATLSFPQPDLIIENTTPHHVMVWTEYTDTSITVKLYSTPHIQVEETGQSVYKVGACTRVDTFRQRTYPDGTVVDDSFFATYRPGEGLDCNGRPTPVPGA